MAKTTKKTAKKKHTDIPLANIPDRLTHTSYSPELKMEAVKRLNAGTESAEEIARALNISNGGMIQKWARTVAEGKPLKARGGARTPKADNVAAQLKAQLAEATRARDERLEAAAAIVEIDGTGREAADLAKKIRAFKHAKPA